MEWMSTQKYPAFSILIVDDEPSWLDSISLSMERLAGITNIITCCDSRRVADILSANEVGLVILDLTMPHLSGQELLQIISEQYPGISAIVLTGINQLETAVSCMKLGAFDYYVKTEEPDRLIKGIMHAIRLLEMRRENIAMRNRLLSNSLEHPEAFSEIVTAGKTMRSVFQYIESVAASSQPILITGESGVGKELIAKAVHRLSGRTGKMVSVNIAGLDDNVFADSLFGHLKGAYTSAESARKGLVEEAAQGTLLLDEVGDLSIASQVKLLRILQEGEYFQLGSDRPKRSQTRIIVSTNQDLNEKMAAGNFRKDLYYRLQTHKVRIPSLRERKEDLPLLLDHFLELSSAELGKKIPAVPRELIPLLETYNFPGNVRELKSMIYDAVTQHKSRILSMDSFLIAMGRSDLPASVKASAAADSLNFFEGLEVLPAIDRTIQMLLDEALRRAKNNQSQAARLLGITQSALNKRLKRTEKRPEDDL
jgi:DNA-binding NtrC family response regulator